MLTPPPNPYDPNRRQRPGIQPGLPPPGVTPPPIGVRPPPFRGGGPTGIVPPLRPPNPPPVNTQGTAEPGWMGGGTEPSWAGRGSAPGLDPVAAQQAQILAARRRGQMQVLR